MKRIEVTVSPQGESRIESYGFEGQSCLAATRNLEKALGAKQADTFKPEFYSSETNNIHQSENE